MRGDPCDSVSQPQLLFKGVTPGGTYEEVVVQEFLRGIEVQILAQAAALGIQIPEIGGLVFVDANDAAALLVYDRYCSRIEMFPMGEKMVIELRRDTVHPLLSDQESRQGWECFSAVGDLRPTRH